MFKELLAGKGYIKSSNPFELFAYFSDQINHIVHELKDEALQKYQSIKYRQQQDKEH